MIDHEKHDSCVQFVVERESGVVLVDSVSPRNIQRLTIMKDGDGDVWFILSSAYGPSAARVCFDAGVLFAAADNYMEADV